MSKRTTIYLNPPLAAALENARSISGRLGTICDRYAEIVRRARIAQRFSEAEINALRDCCNGTFFEPAHLIDGAVLANFVDAAHDGLCERFGIDWAATEAKLGDLSYSEQVALVETLEAYWRGVSLETGAARTSGLPRRRRRNGDKHR